MLNELYDASVSLDTAGISPKNWHTEYVPVRKPSNQKPAFFVYVNADGEIADIEHVDDPKTTAELRTWESKGDLRQSFPYFNVPPLFRIHFNSKKNDNDKLFERTMKAKQLTQEQLRQLMQRVDKADTTKRWDAKACKKLQNCLDKSKALKAKLDQAPEEYRAIIELITRLEHVSVATFRDKLCKAFADKMLRYPDMTAKYFGSMFYSGEKEPGNDVTLLLELSDGTSGFEYPIRHAKVRDWINVKLLSGRQAIANPGSTKDVFGDSPDGSGQPFDEVRMSVLGIVKLRSMAGEAGCQYRYGKAEADSCPVGQPSRERMKGTLEWLTDRVREGKTWATISRAVDSSEILLAYPSVLPPEPPNMATMFPGPKEADTDTKRFPECAADVTGTLRGIMAKNPDLDVRVFVLRKMDTARTRVSSHRRYRAQHLIESAKIWQTGSHNIPRILIKQFGKEGKASWMEPNTPFPMEVIWVLNTLWSRDGTAATRVKTFTAEDGISLLLEQGTVLDPVLRRTLSAAARNAAGLVLGIGQAHAQRKALSVGKNYARQAAIVSSILGLLLFKMNIFKEDYMKSAPCLVGRLFSLADQLHYHYCQHVRDGSVPPQLMGNGLMPTALEEPVKALALCSNRILPYQAWAKTVSGDAAGRARYFLSELGKVSNDISAVTVPERCTDADKAQMLMGYLAHTEKTDSEVTQ